MHLGPFQEQSKTRRGDSQAALLLLSFGIQRRASQRPPSRQAEKELSSQGLGWGRCLALGKVPSEPGPKLRPRPGAEERCQGGEKQPGGKVKVGPPPLALLPSLGQLFGGKPSGFLQNSYRRCPLTQGSWAAGLRRQNNACYSCLSGWFL